jgi:hypothetical protein
VVVAQLLLLVVKTDHLVVAQDLSLPPELAVLQTHMQIHQPTTKLKPTATLAVTTGIQQTDQRVVAVVPVP